MINLRNRNGNIENQLTKYIFIYIISKEFCVFVYFVLETKILFVFFLVSIASSTHTQILKFINKYKQREFLILIV